MRTVITPEALNRSKFKTCRLCDWKAVDGEEAFVFIFPSPNAINQVNGDGDLLEIIDFNTDFTEVDVDRGGGRTKPMKISPDTIIYYR